MEHEIAADHVLHCGRRETFLHRDVEVSGKDALEQFLRLQVRDEIARDGVLLLAPVIARWFGNRRRAELQILASPPELSLRTPDVRSDERHVHAENDRQPLLDLGMKLLQIYTYI